MEQRRRNRRRERMGKIIQIADERSTTL